MMTQKRIIINLIYRLNCCVANLKKVKFLQVEATTCLQNELKTKPQNVIGKIDPLSSNLHFHLQKSLQRNVQIFHFANYGKSTKKTVIIFPGLQFCGCVMSRNATCLASLYRCRRAARPASRPNSNILQRAILRLQLYAIGCM